MGLNSDALIPLSYYQQDDVVALARDLLGKYLVTELKGQRSVGRITETEAYCGRGDKACHAHLQRKTKRNQVMFEMGGQAYVYLCYGIHHLFNIVTNKAGYADAVLIRATEPLEGIEHQLSRRAMTELAPKISAGPGNMSKALGISTALYGTTLDGPEIYLLEGEQVPDKDVKAAPRIGINYAGEDAALPWRFYQPSSRYVSKKD